MINLNYLTGISIISLGLLVFLGGNDLLAIRKRETNSLGYITLLEESKYILPSVLRNYYMHVINWSKIKLISLFTVSFWYNNTERKEEKENKNNRQLGYLRLKFIALTYALILYALLIIFWHYFSRTKIGYQYKPEVIEWLGTRINTFLFLTYGLDGLSLPFVLLVVFIMPIVYFSNWTTVDKDDGYYTSIVGLLEWFLVTVFIVIDLIMFYVFFESILPPLFVMIGLYGASQKFRAGYYLFLYTLLGSLFMLMVFVKMGGDTATTYFEGFGAVNIYTLLQEIIWVILFVSFSVKTPLVPVHIWLPLAHSDANVSGSIVLASIVLKLALYGFIRILIGIFTFATSILIPFFYGLCSLSVVYSSLTTIRQFDLKVLVAYSSIAHMASSLLGTFSDTLYGLVGSIIFGLAHGFVSPGLFILVGAVLYDRCGSRIINYYRGLSNLLPFFALLFLLFVFGNMGVPLTGNFIGEFLSLLGAYQQNIFIASIGATSVILSAVYSIFMYNRVTSGAISPFVHTIPDIFRKEFYIILPLLVLTLLLGIYPCFITYDVEFGLSNYLLFTIFPVTLMDKSGKSEEVNSNPLDMNSEKQNLNSDSDQIIENNTSSSTENIVESSSVSDVVPDNTKELGDTASTLSDNESHASDHESGTPKDIYFNITGNAELSDSIDKNSDSVKESKSGNEESVESKSDNEESVEFKSGNEESVEPVFYGEESVEPVSDDEKSVVSESDGEKSDSEDDHEYEEIEGDDDSDDSDDEKIKNESENTQDDNSKENDYYNDNNANQEPIVVNEEPPINEEPPVQNDGNLTDASIITNYSDSEDEDRNQPPSSCSSYGSDVEDDHSPASLSALRDFISNMFNGTNNNDNNNDNNDNNNNDNNDDNNDNENNDNNSEDNDNNNGNEGNNNHNDDDDPFGLRAAPRVPHNSPETQFTMPNQNNVPGVRRGGNWLSSNQNNSNEDNINEENINEDSINEDSINEDNINEENRNEETNEGENNNSEADSNIVNNDNSEDLYGTSTSNTEVVSNRTNENNNYINGENKDSSKNDKDSNTNFKKTGEEREEIIHKIKSIKDEEQWMPFAFHDIDFINYWIKFIKTIDSFSYSLKELLGLLISTGLTNIYTCLFLALFMKRIYKLYCIHIRPILPIYLVRFVIWKMEIMNFINKYMKKK